MKFGALLFYTSILTALFFNTQAAVFAQSGQFTEPALVERQNFVLPAEEHVFDSYKNDYPKDYFAGQGLIVERPFWRKLDEIKVESNRENQFLRRNFEYSFELDYNLSGLIFEVSKVRDSDLFSLEIVSPNGQKTVYHNLREILHSKADAGKYKIKVDSEVFEQIGLKIYEADLIYPHSGALLVNDDDTKHNYQNELKTFVSRGGTVINLGSENIDKFLLQLFAGFQNIEIEGQTSKLRHVDSRYFYIPKDLFLEEETAARVVKVLKEKLNLQDNATEGISFLAALLFAVLIGGLLYKNRRDLKKWTYESLYPAVRSMVGFGLFLAVLLIIVIPLFIYWYKNFSGLDLLPGITIDEIITGYNLRLLAKIVLTLIAFTVVLFAALIALKSEKKHVLKQKSKIRLAKDFKNSAWLFALALIVVISFLSTFTTNKEEDIGKRLQLVHTAHVGVFQDPELSLQSTIPLVLNSEPQSRFIIAETLPGPEEIEGALTNQNADELIVYTDIKEAMYFGKFENEVSGQLVLRNKNREFGNKNFFLHLTDINGVNKKTIHVEGSASLLGQEPELYTHDFNFDIDKPGIYGIKLENSDLFKKGDFELASIKANTNKLLSLNDVRSRAARVKKNINLRAGSTFSIEPYQLEKADLKGFWVSY